VVSFALPALVFRAVSSREISEIINIGYLGGYLYGSLIMFLGGYLWSRRIAGLKPIECTFQGMGVSCANSGFIGYPIVLMAMPAVASTALALNMIVENLVIIPLILIMAEHASGGTVRGIKLAKQISQRVIKNPIIIALIAGLIVSILKIKLPEIITEPVNIIASSSAALSLVVIGGTLAGLHLSSINSQIMGMVTGKLLLHPLAVWLGIVLLAMAGFSIADEQLRTAAILIAATPAMGIYPILAQRYGQQGVAALSMFLMTLLSFFTISILLLLI
jgi:malonate transporter and related proteins